MMQATLALVGFAARACRVVAERRLALGARRRRPRRELALDALRHHADQPQADGDRPGEGRAPRREALLDKWARLHAVRTALGFAATSGIVPARRRCAAWHAERALRLQHRVPVEIVEPALVQVVGREEPAVVVQVVHASARRAPAAATCSRRGSPCCPSSDCTARRRSRRSTRSCGRRASAAADGRTSDRRRRRNTGTGSGRAGTR